MAKTWGISTSSVWGILFNNRPNAETLLPKKNKNTRFPRLSIPAHLGTMTSAKGHEERDGRNRSARPDQRPALSAGSGGRGRARPQSHIPVG